MIAVFTKTDMEFFQLALTPKREFKRITKKSDLGNHKFIGVILLPLFWQSVGETEDAYKLLKEKQPYLFIDL